LLDVRVISIGTLAAHPLWGERGAVRMGHSTTTLVRSGDVTLLIDPGLPEPAIVARLMERANVPPDGVTHVFLTSFHPDTHRGIGAFKNATWWISKAEREGVGLPLIQQLKRVSDGGEKEAVEILTRQVEVLHRCEEAPETLADRVDVFPLPGMTPGLTGVLVEEPELTTLICGDAVATVEHLRRKMVLGGCANPDKARESFAEALQIADVLVLGRDGLVVNTVDIGAI
jgi:glyoxylase-like metal-dependent hydrolase (beta-lactamase superfamily II)